MVDLLKTPADWPTDPPRARRRAPDPTDLDAAVRGGRVRRAAARRSATSAATATIATIAGVRPARPGRRRLPDRRQVADRGGDRRPAPLRRGQRLRRGPGDRHGSLPARARPVRGHRGRGHRRLRDRRERGRSSRSGPTRPRRSARLEAAIGAAEEAGFIGFDVLGSGHDIVVTVRPVQGAYMLGEETVLLKALEGKRGQPEQRPPHPAERGLYDMPTVVHNVQTARRRARGSSATAPRRSPRSARRTARARSSSRSGRRPATASPRSRSGRRCARSSGSAASCRPAASIKAVLVGGPSGGLLPPDLLDTPYAFEPLRAAGAHIGSGSVVVADDRACIVDLARLLTRFCAGEACGKTIPCRIGTRRLVEIADRVVEGRPRPTDPTLARPTCRPTSWRPPCATTSA